MISSQPLCWICWETRYPHRKPTRPTAGVVACCCLCSAVTYSGIVVQLDSRSVPYPVKEVAS